MPWGKREDVHRSRFDRLRPGLRGGGRFALTLALAFAPSIANSGGDGRPPTFVRISADSSRLLATAHLGGRSPPPYQPGAPTWVSAVPRPDFACALSHSSLSW